MFRMADAAPTPTLDPSASGRARRSTRQDGSTALIYGLWAVAGIELAWLWTRRPDNWNIVHWIPIATILSPLYRPDSRLVRTLFAAGIFAANVAGVGLVWLASFWEWTLLDALMVASWPAYLGFAAATAAKLRPTVSAPISSVLLGATTGALVVAKPFVEPERGYYLFLAGGPASEADSPASFRPGAVVRDYYPANPRGYFDEEPIAQAEAHRRWRYVESGRASGRLRLAPSDAGFAARLEVAAADPDRRESVQAGYQAGEFLPRQWWTVSFVARASSTREATAQWTCAGQPPSADDPVWRLRLRPEWRWFHWEFVHPRTEGLAELRFSVGDKEGWVEIDSVEVRTGADAFRPAAPPKAHPWFVEYHIHRDGFRGREFARRTPSDPPRIACLGGAAAFGRGVRDADSLPARLEAELSGSTPCHVFNLATPGRGAAETVRVYEKWGVPLGAEVVVAVVGGTAGSNCFPFLPSTESTGGEPSETAAALVDLSAACRRNGAVLVAVWLPGAGGNGSAEALEALRRGLQGSGVEILDGGAPLQAAGLADWRVHDGDPRPNEQAFAVVAKQIAEWIVRRGLLGGAGAPPVWRGAEGTQ
jgi:hypothetical protein